MTTLVVGCGYLGRRVAARLVGRGERVIGTTRHPEKAEALARIGIEPLILNVLDPASARPDSSQKDSAGPTPHPNPPSRGGRGPEGPDTESSPSPLEGEGSVGGKQGSKDGPGLPPFDRLVYCVGFDRTSGRSMREVYVEGLKQFLGLVDDHPSRFVYTSSTGVYGQDDGSWVTEDDPAEPRTESGRVALEAEMMARDHGAIVVRLAGLYGPGRIIRRAAILAGEPIAGDPAKRVNLVHVDDAAGAVVEALDRGTPGRVYNVADDRPVARAELYGITARCLGAPAPRFVATPSEEADRRVANRRMRDELGVVLAYPDAATGLPASIEAERVSPPQAR